jgi:CDP-glucose 4,6-dehydratase
MNYLSTDLMDFFPRAFAGKRVFITGHTGFKGSWLSEWLLECGAEVHGYALEPVSEPSLFSQLKLDERIKTHTIADIRDRVKLGQVINGCSPDFVFHLAAQPLVVASYEQPYLTFETNIVGTMNLLELLRGFRHNCTAVFVTSDKCYRNDNNGEAFRETDPLGGDDPYSASKGAMEIVVHSYRKSFFRDSPVRLATVRAGNVIGGGDYAADRIIPDCVRALSAGRTIHVRNPAHTRPWQHVLEPLSGYMWLAARLREGFEDPEDLYAFNFGPADEGHRSVGALVEAVLKCWPGQWECPAAQAAPYESHKLALSIRQARERLDWHPRWDFGETVRQTIGWYREAAAIDATLPAAYRELTLETIRNFSKTNG